MPGLWHTESHANPTLPPTDTQVLSQKQPLQPYLLPWVLFACAARLPTCRVFPAIHQLLGALLCSGVPQPGREGTHDTGHHSMLSMCPPSWAQRHEALAPAETGVQAGSPAWSTGRFCTIRSHSRSCQESA